MAKPKRVDITDPDAILRIARAAAAQRYGETEVDPEWHPIVEGLVAAQDPKLTPLQRANVAERFAAFLFPKKKAMEVKGDANMTPNIQIITYAAPTVKEAIPHDDEGRRPALPAPGGPEADSGD